MESALEIFNTTLAGNCMDELVLLGIRHIKASGQRISARAGKALQAYSVNYLLKNPRNRVHALRQPASIRYLCREFLAYFRH